MRGEREGGGIVVRCGGVRDAALAGSNSPTGIVVAESIPCDSPRRLMAGSGSRRPLVTGRHRPPRIRFRSERDGRRRSSPSESYGVFHSSANEPGLPGMGSRLQGGQSEIGPGSITDPAGRPTGFRGTAVRLSTSNCRTDRNIPRRISLTLNQITRIQTTL